MNKKQRPYLDFYKEKNIAPVSQDITDLEKHFQRRDALYRHLGLPSSFISGKRVLEIGPGTGHNAFFTNSLKPKEYTLLDANPKSLETTKALLNSKFKDISNIRIVEADLTEYDVKEQFDLVMAEGLIPTQIDPHSFLKKVSKFVKPGALLIMTCMDHVSWLSEILRRVAAMIISSTDKSHDEHMSELRAFFRPHLNSLKGMSRPIDDWILDNILQPVYGKLFSIKDAIETLDENFDVYGMSPRFCLDLRWYKDIHGKNSHNQRTISAFLKNIPNFLDYRFEFKEIDEKLGEILYSKSVEIFDLVLEIQNTGLNSSLIKSLSEKLDEFESLCEFSSDTRTSIQSFKEALEDYNKTGIFPLETGPFATWFGRGQQYLSFIRKSKFTDRL